MKILNLYSGIGGNRKRWKGHEVTAVEYDEQIAAIYTDMYPDDEVVVGDAHQYLLDHYQEFDMIWTSPPCQTHSSFRQNISVRFRGTKPVYADMRLYEEIIFLQYNYDGIYVVENVKPYYSPLIEPDAVLQRHNYWTNIELEDMDAPKSKLRSAQILDLQKYLGIDISEYKVSNRRQVLRNCVHPSIGEHIINSIKTEEK